MPTDVLVVDDEPDILQILEETLAFSGFQVKAVDGGQAALDYLEDHQPDLIITDLRMPRVSGMELLKQARTLCPDTLVIILTGYGDMESAIDALRLGAYDYLSKPVEMERLFQTLRNGAERRRLVLENRALIGRLQEANRIKTEFINRMSHEFRTPLGQIMGFGQVLQDTLTDLSDRQSRYLQNIQKAATSLLGMLDNILQFSVLRSGETRIDPQPVSLLDLLNTTLDAFQSPAAEKNLTLEHRPPQPDRLVLLDSETCGKALSLILDNAVKFTPAGGRVTLASDIRPEPACPDNVHPDILGSAVHEWLHIAVSDTGPGIAPEDHERIFTLFEQGEAGLDRAHEGTGIGLPLSRSLARIHGGDLVMETEPGSGSTFTLILPLPQA